MNNSIIKTLYINKRTLTLNLYLVVSILFDIIIILKTYANRSAKNEFKTKKKHKTMIISVLCFLIKFQLIFNISVYRVFFLLKYTNHGIPLSIFRFIYILFGHLIHKALACNAKRIKSTFLKTNFRC